MKKAHYTFDLFYWLVTSALIGILMLNLFSLISTRNLITLFPIVIQTVLITLIISKNKFAKIGLKLWAFLFLILAFGLQFIGRLLQDSSTNFENFLILPYVRSGSLIIAGIIIVVLTNRTVEIKEFVNEQ